MRIHHFLHPHDAQGGAPLSHVSNLAKAQAQSGHEVGITLLDAGSRFINHELLARLGQFCSLGVNHLAIEQGNRFTRSWSARRAFRDAARLVRKTRPDILHGHDLKGGHLACHVHKSIKTSKSVYSPHGAPMCTDQTGADQKGTNGNPWPFSTSQKRLWKHIDGLLFESAHCEKTYIQRFGPPACATRIIYDGLREEQFAPRQIIDLASDFLFMGELKPQQGINTLIKALARMKKHHTTSALIVGSGPEEKELRAQVDRYGLSHEIFFNAPLVTNTAFLKGGCLVLPSRDGAIPPALLPAAAAGMPMILTDMGGIKEVIGQVKMPLIPPNDTNALQEQLVAYLTNPNQFLGRAAVLKKRIAKYFTLERMNTEVEQFYQSLMTKD